MKVLITGITGTLGQAFNDHLSSLGHDVSGIDHNEERVASMPNATLGDFSEVQITSDLVIHLAAFKHIDLCETTPSACISNNVIKTYQLFRNIQRAGADILFMSTDKAVEPCSMYGYSKALMEGMAKEIGGAIARSGNILASNGSVIHLWERMIQAGEPLRITHKGMRRFFITPEHLAERVWDLYLAGEREIIPKMDMDIALLDLADQTLQKFGFRISNYPIEFTGLRPGEKLVEKLYM